MTAEFVGLQKLLGYLGIMGHHRAGIAKCLPFPIEERKMIRWMIVVFVASIGPQAFFSTYSVC